MQARRWLLLCTFLPPATKLGQGDICRSVCQKFCSQGRGYPSMHCRFLSTGRAGEGVSRPAPMGEVEGSGLRGSPGPHPDGYCCGRYASYWNAFLLNLIFEQKVKKQKTHLQIPENTCKYLSKIAIERKIKTSNCCKQTSISHVMSRQVHLIFSQKVGAIVYVLKLFVQNRYLQLKYTFCRNGYEFVIIGLCILDLYREESTIISQSSFFF